MPEPMIRFFERRKAVYQAFVEKRRTSAVILTRSPEVSSAASIKAMVKVSTFQNRAIRKHLR